MKTLICKLDINKDFLNDILDDESGRFSKILLVNMLLENINEELKKKKRRISKIKNPVKLICQVKTVKI